VQPGLSELPGIPAVDGEIVGTSGHRSPPIAPRAGVYDEYFPIGSAPTEICPVHNEVGVMDAVGTSGEAAPASGSTHIEKVIGPDGRITWVIKH
jgi:hypothetical protein